MKDAGIQPNVISYSALIRACTTNNQYERGMALFNEMTEKGNKPTEVTYSTLLHLCEKTGNG